MAISTFAHGLLVPLYLEDAGLSESYIGLTVGALSLALVFARFLSGWAIDQWGPRRFMIGGALAWGISAALTVVSVALLPLLLIRLFQGIALAFFTNAAIGYISHATEASTRGRVLAVWWMAWSSAVAIGPLVGGAVLNRWGFGAAFLMTAVLGVVAALPTLFVPDQPPAHEGTAGGGVMPRSALLPFVLGVAIGYTSGGFGAFLPLIGRDLGLVNPGVLLTALGIGIVAAQSVLGRLSDQRGRGAAMVPALVVAMIAVVLLGNTSSVAVAVVCSFLLGAGTSGVSPVLTAWAMDRATQAQRTRAASSSIAARELGSFAGATGMGALLQTWGQGGAYTAAVLILGVGLALVLMAERPRATRPPD